MKRQYRISEDPGDDKGISKKNIHTRDGEKGGFYVVMNLNITKRDIYGIIS